jgi:hypothetical protein
MMRVARWGLTLSLVVAVANLEACGGGSNGGGRVDGGGGWIDDGGVAHDGPHPYVQDANTSNQDGGLPTCHEQSVTANRTSDPDIMIVLDVSGSMAWGTPTKLSVVASAVAATVTNLQNRGTNVQWGLIRFPQGDQCQIGSAPDVTIDSSSGATVISRLSSSVANGATPTAQAVTLATSYFQTLSDGRDHFILLATDGEPNCDTALTRCDFFNRCPTGKTCVKPLPGEPGDCYPNDGNMAATQAVGAALAAGIKTYVLGISIDGWDVVLNRMAEVGGTARATTPKYYPVADQTSMEQALATITGSIISCTFTLDQKPPDIELVQVSNGATSVPRDANHQNGWDVDAAGTTMTLYGAACDTMRQNPQNLSVKYLCPPPA